MRSAAPTLTLTADHGDWSEDLAWLAETRIRHAFAAAAAGAHMHLACRGLRRSDGCHDLACRVEVRLVDGDLVAAEATRRTPQAAILAAVGLVARRVPVRPSPSIQSHCVH